MDDFTTRVAHSIGRHFVTLSCVQHIPEKNEMKTHIFSGFIVTIEDEWFYITAGHILRRIQQAIAAGSTFDIWRLGDQTAGKRTDNHAVPYAFELERWLVLEDETTGLDYATMHIGGLYRQQLEAGGVTAIARNAWGDHVTEHDYWVLAGIPSETVSYDGKTKITARFVMTRVTPESAPLIAEQKAQNQFYARLLNGSEQVVNDVDGMSGGPLFMLKNIDGA